MDNSISKLHGLMDAEKRNYTVGPSGYIATLMRIPEMYTDTLDNKKLIIGIKIGIEFSKGALTLSSRRFEDENIRIK